MSASAKRIVWLSLVMALLGLPLVLTGCGTKTVGASQIAFVTGADTNITAGQPSAAITIQTRNADGDPAAVEADTTVKLASTSATGKFDTSASGAFDGTVVSVTIAIGSSSASFYYEDTTARTPTITAAASSYGLASASQSRTIVAASVSKLAFTSAQTNITTGKVSSAIIVQTQDTYGNPATVNTNTTINLASTSGAGAFDTSSSGTFDGTVVSVTMANGTGSASFYYKDAAAGTPTITASSSGLTSVSQKQTIMVGSASMLAFVTTPQTSITVGTASAVITIRSQDAYGNLANVSASTTVYLTSTSPTGKFDSSASGAFDGTVVSVTMAIGTSSTSFYYKDTTVRTPTITVSSSALTSASQIETIVGYVFKLVLTTSPQTNIAAGQASAVMTVQTQDTYGNPANVATATTIMLASTSGTGKFDTSASGAFDGSVVSITIAGGSNSASFYYKDASAGTPTITASSSGLTSASQSETIV
ncbi:MAG: hypothetical protein NTU41_09295 [Chloroflexi bacterium]|nr:hypothetical protein [Chloroflexota bacterium]